MKGALFLTKRFIVVGKCRLYRWMVIFLEGLLLLNKGKTGNHGESKTGRIDVDALR